MRVEIETHGHGKDPKTIVSKITSFCSGAGNVSDILGLIKADLPVGLTLDRLKIDSIVYKHVVEYALNSGKVMIDSGAFNVFKRNLKIRNRNEQLIFEGKEPLEEEKIDFSIIMKAYDKIVADTNGRVLLVAPDVVGDQLGTLLELEKHAFGIRDLLDRGANATVSIQKGDMSPRDAYALTVDILGTDNFAVAIPSNAEAFSDDDLKNLLSGDLIQQGYFAVKPKHIHFLGMTTASKKFKAKKEIVQKFSPTTIITLDGNRITAKVGQGRPITKKQKELNEAQVTEYFEQKIDENLEVDVPRAKAGVGDYQGYEDGGDLIDQMLNGGDLTISELEKLMDEYSPVDCQYTSIELADIYVSDGGQNSKRLAEILEKYWCDNDYFFLSIKEFVEQRLNQGIREDTFKQAEALTKGHSSEFRSHAVFKAMKDDPYPVDFEEEIFAKTIR